MCRQAHNKSVQYGYMTTQGIMTATVKFTNSAAEHCSRSHSAMDPWNALENIKLKWELLNVQSRLAVLKSAVTVIAARGSCVFHQPSYVCLDFYVKAQPLYTERTALPCVTWKVFLRHLLHCKFLLACGLLPYSSTGLSKDKIWLK